MISYEDVLSNVNSTNQSIASTASSDDSSQESNTNKIMNEIGLQVQREEGQS